jgi:lipoprotein-anchoring transpeptidase ErfK/SrfK
MPAIAAAGVLGVVVLAGISGKGEGGSASSTSSGSSIAGSVVETTEFGDVSETGLTVPSNTVDALVVVTDPAASKTSLSQSVGKGNFGDDVKLVQQRLTDLAFAPGPVDGAFGSGTQQAVWAFEKLVMRTPRSQATGRVTDAMWQVMQDKIEILPRRQEPGRTHMEVYLPEQVAVVFDNDKPVLITHISSGKLNPDGTPEVWCQPLKYDTDSKGNKVDPPIERDECGNSYTPGGVFKFYRRYEGKRVGALGGMTNPVYFNFGIAVHGAENIPLEPASHGCIRINQTIAAYFPSLVANGDRVYVWGQDGKEPEQYSKRQTTPIFNYPNPNSTSTTSSTTSLPPATTAVGTTTTVKTASSTTTTVKPTSTTTTSTLPPATTSTTAPPAATTTTTTTP